MEKRAFIGFLKDEKGQAMVELGLTIALFLAFIFGMLGTCLWGITSFMCQEAAHAVAREFASSEDKAAASTKGQEYLDHWAFPFIQGSSISIEDCGECGQARVTVYPRSGLQSLYFFLDSPISRESRAVKSYALRYKYQF